MHLEDAPAGAAEAVPAEAEHGGLLGVALQIESRAPSNPLRTHKERRRKRREGTRRGDGEKGGNGPRLRARRRSLGAPVRAAAVTAITPNGASDRGQFNLSVYTGRRGRGRKGPPSHGLARKEPGSRELSPLRSHATCRILFPQSSLTVRVGAGHPHPDPHVRYVGKVKRGCGLLSLASLSPFLHSEEKDE